MYVCVQDIATDFVLVVLQREDPLYPNTFIYLYVFTTHRGTRIGIYYIRATYKYIFNSTYVYAYAHIYGSISYMDLYLHAAPSAEIKRKMHIKVFVGTSGVPPQYTVAMVAATRK